MDRAMELKPQDYLRWLLIGTGAMPGDAPSPQVDRGVLLGYPELFLTTDVTGDPRVAATS